MVNLCPSIGEFPKWSRGNGANRNSCRSDRSYGRTYETCPRACTNGLPGILYHTIPNARSSVAHLNEHWRLANVSAGWVFIRNSFGQAEPLPTLRPTRLSPDQADTGYRRLQHLLKCRLNDELLIVLHVFCRSDRSYGRTCEACPRAGTNGRQPFHEISLPLVLPLDTLSLQLWGGSATLSKRLSPICILRTTLTFLLVCLLLVGCFVRRDSKILSPGPVRHPKWKFEIRLDKAVYLFRESIFLDIVLTNIGDDSVRVPPLSLEARNGSLDIELINAKEETLKYTGGVFSTGPERSPLRYMQPGETLFRCINLLRSNGFHKNFYDQIYFPHLPTGDYRVEAKHGGMYSNQQVFTVTYPEGDEKRAYDSLIAAYFPDPQFILPPFKDSAQRETKFIQEFPNSAYAEYVLSHLAYETGPYAQFLERYPNSGFSFGLLSSLLRDATDTSGTLLDIIRNHPETRSARFAEQMLRDLRK